MRHVPLFLETEIYGEIRSGGGGWTDLRTLKYRNDGTRPGHILLTSEDGRVKIEIMARRKAALSPIFVRYSFSSLVDFRLTARFQRPEFTKSERADDSSGYAKFTIAWRDQNAVLTTSAGPDLYLATLPTGRTVSIDGTGTVKEVDSTSEVILCIDATEANIQGPAGKSIVDAWRGNLGGYTDTEYSRAVDHVSLVSDNPKLDRLFAYSIDAIESHQFASGNLLADLFFYRDSWIRDGSYTIIGLSLAGNYQAAERFFAFWDANRNSYVGGEREAQQPAIGVTAMWLYSRLAPDGTSFLKTHWSWVKEYCNHCADRVGKEGMMNVAEEWICFIPSPATWPNAEIYGGLRAGAKIAKALDQPKEEAEWTRAADRRGRERLAANPERHDTGSRSRPIRELARGERAARGDRVRQRQRKPHSSSPAPGARAAVADVREPDGFAAADAEHDGHAKPSTHQRGQEARVERPEAVQHVERARRVNLPHPLTKPRSKRREAHEAPTSARVLEQIGAAVELIDPRAFPKVLPTAARPVLREHVHLVPAGELAGEVQQRRHDALAAVEPAGNDEADSQRAAFR